MASFIFSLIGTLFGSTLGPLGAFFGSKFGNKIGNILDRKLFGLEKTRQIGGYRLNDFQVQSSVYGKTIPLVYGSMRTPGNIIWAQPIKEVVSRETYSTPTGFFSSQKTEVTNYLYYATLAIALCEGEIDGIRKIWADFSPIDLGKIKYRLYKGSKDQLPDPLIVSVLGADDTPSYRDLAYIVIEDFQINDYGGRVPNFTFEVVRNLSSNVDVEHKIKGVNIIPGSGEFVYDTNIQFKVDQSAGVDGTWRRINNNTENTRADSLVGIDQMQRMLPNLEWASVVVVWFFDSLDAQKCAIYPAVEFKNIYRTTPDPWNVAGLGRIDAREVLKDENNRPIYGGTPSDLSVINYIQALKNKGFKVALYPMLFANIKNKPWRGYITGSAQDAESFYKNSKGSATFSYKDFILHYARLNKGIDAFIIGSELKGLTGVSASDNGAYPFVENLKELAGLTKGILGAGKIITYAADWSEYHSKDGIFNLDPLWSDPNIDVVGIDAYFPLTDRPSDPPILYSEILAGWDAGPGYDYYYDSAGVKVPYSGPEYAWKNIDYWWGSIHKNPDAQITAWTPGMKKVWFTEYGFASTSGTTNSPNVFYDPASLDSGLPKFSSGYIDPLIQEAAIKATIDRWSKSDMLENMLLWCYDARPYPYFPTNTSVWSDGPLWQAGHWINGKFGKCYVKSALRDLLVRADLDKYFEADDLGGTIEGAIFNVDYSILDIINLLGESYFFDLTDVGVRIKANPKSMFAFTEIDCGKLVVPEKGDIFTLKTVDFSKQLRALSYTYLGAMNDYAIQNLCTTHDAIDENGDVITNRAAFKSIEVPFAFSRKEGAARAQTLMEVENYCNEIYEFGLSLEYARLEPMDLVRLNFGDRVLQMRIVGINFGDYLEITAIKDSPKLYNLEFNPKILEIANSSKLPPKTGATRFLGLEIPIIPPPQSNFDSSVGSIAIAASGFEDNWLGAVIVVKRDGEILQQYQHKNVSTFGIALFEGNIMRVSLTSGNFKNSEGKTLAAWGNEIIRFENPVKISNNVYEITNPERGLYGTEYFMSPHTEADSFIILDNFITYIPLRRNLCNQKIDIGVYTIGAPSQTALYKSFDIKCYYLRPWPPINFSTEEKSANNFLVTWQPADSVNGSDTDLAASIIGAKLKFKVVFGGVETIVEKPEFLAIKLSLSEVQLSISQISSLGVVGFEKILSLPTRD